MAAKDEERSPLPPYIPFKTFLGFVQRLKETAVPERIDLSLLRNYSGSTARQIIAALKYLGMIEEGGRTKPKLEQLVQAYETEKWQETLSDAIFDSYREMLANINLDVATPSQLEEKFRAAGADGQVLQKCVGFFVAAVTNAGVKLSPHIVNRPRAKPDRSKTKGKKGREEDNDMTDEEDETSPPAGTVQFSVPIPDKGMAKLNLPPDITSEDWDMVSTMVKAYVARKQKEGK